MGHVIFSDEERRFLAKMRVARLATADPARQPHVMPIVFAASDRRIYTPVDHKPKRVPPRQLKRIRNISCNPKVGLVVDHYDENWNHLAWLLVTGDAEIVERGELHIEGVGLLQNKYNQYETMPLDKRLLIVITPRHLTSWGLFPTG